MDGAGNCARNPHDGKLHRAGKSSLRARAGYLTWRANSGDGERGRLAFYDERVTQLSILASRIERLLDVIFFCQNS